MMMNYLFSCKRCAQLEATLKATVTESTLLKVDLVTAKKKDKQTMCDIVELEKKLSSANDELFLLQSDIDDYNDTANKLYERIIALVEEKNTLYNQNQMHERLEELRRTNCEPQEQMAETQKHLININSSDDDEKDYIPLPALPDDYEPSPMKSFSLSGRDSW
jgi:chromosome segregation ATPase